MIRPVINVDCDGLDADGLSYDDLATPEAVASGFVINRPVLLRFPDGHTREANEVRLTEKGVLHLAEDRTGRRQ